MEIDDCSRARRPRRGRLLDRDFTHGGAESLLVADITYLRSWEGWLCLVAVQTSNAGIRLTGNGGLCAFGGNASFSGAGTASVLGGTAKTIVSLI